MLLNWRMDGENVVRLHNGAVAQLENKTKQNKTKNNKEILKFTGKWMELEETILSEVTQSQKDKYDKIGCIQGGMAIDLSFISNPLLIMKN
ncbi:protein of unknown function DUF1725 containing protein [Cricetulus griseus]|nr:protein of unknown function DUF1725 containing protein [Cricetulus griseus]